MNKHKVDSAYKIFAELKFSINGISVLSRFRICMYVKKKTIIPRKSVRFF